MARAYGDRPVDAVLRALDIVTSGLILVGLSPLLLVVAGATRLLSGPPVLYRGLRVGRGGNLFTMYKLRTLRVGAEARLAPYYGRPLTERTQAEVTAIGRLLRDSHLDEIPQLWNVLKGDMSMVGPRPIRPELYADVTERVPQYWQRLVVRPGVTGFAQLRVTREDAWSDKLVHDLEYIADRSVSLYLWVLGATILRVVGRTAHVRDGAAEPPSVPPPASG